MAKAPFIATAAMDVSSRYFSAFKQPGPHRIHHFWNFLLTVYRVGKLTELVSFVIWEISHRLGCYRLTNRYVQFTDTGHWTITDVGTLNAPTKQPFLAQVGYYFEPVAIDWKYCCQMADGSFWGCRFSHLNGLYTSHDQSRSAVLRYEFAHPVASLFISRRDELFVCVNGVICKSSDGGYSFRAVLSLSTSISYFLFNNGMTELPDHTLMIGEYGSIWLDNHWQNLAYLYSSSDGGDTWATSDFLIRQGVNKHIHLVKYVNHLNAVLLTDGDNKKQVWANATLTHFDHQSHRQKAGWRLINRFHLQTGGYTSMAEANGAVVFGSDYLGGTNFIVRTTDGRRWQKRVMPDPYRRSPVMNMVTRQLAVGEEIWASSYSCLSKDARSLLMCTRDGGKTWTRVIDFDGTKHEVRLVCSSPPLSGALYISITEFNPQLGQHRHWVYRLAESPVQSE